MQKKLAVLILVLLPFLVSAQTVSSIDFTNSAKVSGSFAQVVTDDTPSDGTEVDPVYCPKLSTTISKGSTDVTSGGQVSELQNFLMDYYDWTPITMSRGTFDRATQRVLIGFQKEQGLPAYGIAGS